MEQSRKVHLDKQYEGIGSRQHHTDFPNELKLPAHRGHPRNQHKTKIIFKCSNCQHQNEAADQKTGNKKADLSSFFRKKSKGSGYGSRKDEGGHA